MVEKKDAQNDANHGDKWYLQKQDGSEYGPETLATMSRWAAESRLVSGNKLSADKKEWTLVEEIPELNMNWLAELADGRRYGPFNIGATQDLVAHKVLPDNATLTHRQSGETTTVSAYLEAPDAVKTQVSESPKTAETSPEANDEQEEESAEAVTSDHAEPKGAVDTSDNQSEPDSVQPDENMLAETAASADVEPVASESQAPPAKKKRAKHKAATPRNKEEPKEVDLFGGVEDEPETSGVAADPADVKPTEDNHDAAPEEEQKAPAKKDKAPAPAKMAKGKDQESVVNAKIEAIKTRLAESDKERRAATRQLNEANAALKQLEAERDGARKIAVVQDAGFKKKLMALENELKEARAHINSPQQIPETHDNESSEPPAELEQRLNAAMGELKKARNSEVKAAETLKTIEQQVARKTAIQDKRVQDLISERNSLAQLIEVETSQIKRLRVVLIVLGVVIAALLILLMFRGCNGPVAQTVEPLSAEAVAERGAGYSESGRTGTDQQNGVVRRVPFPVIHGTEGLRVMYSRTGSSIVFDEGVFTKGTELSADAKRMLIDLAPQFRPFLAEYELLVEGHSDNQRLRGSSTYRNNTELAQARAREAARFLNEQCDIPLTAMRVISAGSSNPPYPNDTGESRAKNRTVVLKLLRHASN